MEVGPMTDHILTDAEVRTLQIVQGGAGKTSWYQIARLLSPNEFPKQDINAVRLLAKLEQAELIEKVPGGDKMQWFHVTEKGAALLRAAPPPS